ncbi:hypothetical protein AJ80_03440 [Polytolypa hystricis UAMH7299]|uniref:Enoyl reductase (ER) domain-containing protein n=1 Tax=Polytolypa hystricis (strain UAMH7299) TaxID=1447883 RepID=A0A2B7YIH4_POLH7|nr:hypothetical protein AJ80_03440 [Polytolypa hystricis UAMH7299]
MKEAFVSKTSNDEFRVELRDSPIPKPNADQVVIRVVAVGLNPKDWKYTLAEPSNQGDDIAGYIHSVGEDVRDFRPGDRVAAFHEMMNPHGGYAEYAVAYSHTTFHIPESTSFEEAATIPLAAMTAALGLFFDLQLPSPWTPASKPTPLIVYGGASTVGSFAIKLASLANIHPIITVAGSGIPSIQPLLDPSKGDAVIDYRKGDESVITSLRAALKGAKATIALDAVSEHDTIRNLSHVLEPEVGKIALILPAKEVEKPVTQITTYVGSVHSDDNVFMKDTPRFGKLGQKEFGAVYFKFFARGLEGGWFSGHPHRIVEGGLEGLANALSNMRAGKVSAFKYVVRIADTPGLEKAQG